MRHLYLLTVLALLCASCTNTPKSLYSWNDYENASYSYYKDQTPESSEKLMKTYQAMINNPKGSRKVAPPGIHAEYGYLLLQNNKKDEGLAMFQKEKELYPQSAIFMDRLIKQFSE